MSYSRITITLDRKERAALMQLASSEMREPRDQVRYILRNELKRLGLIDNEKPYVLQRQDTYDYPVSFNIEGYTLWISRMFCTPRIGEKVSFSVDDTRILYRVTDVEYMIDGSPRVFCELSQDG